MRLNNPDEDDDFLGEKDAALIIRENGNMELRLPKGEDDDYMAPNALMVAALSAVLVKNPALREQILDWFVSEAVANGAATQFDVENKQE